MPHEKGTWEEYQKLVLGELERLERNAIVMQNNINQLQLEISHNRAKILETLNIELEATEKQTVDKLEEQAKAVNSRLLEEIRIIQGRLTPLETAITESKGVKKWITWAIGIGIIGLQLLNYLKHI